MPPAATTTVSAATAASRGSTRRTSELCTAGVGASSRRILSSIAAARGSGVVCGPPAAPGRGRVQPHRCGGGRAAECLAQVGTGQLLPMSEHQHLAIGLGEPAQDERDQYAVVVGFRAGHRGRLAERTDPSPTRR